MVREEGEERMIIQGGTVTIGNGEAQGIEFRGVHIILGESASLTDCKIDEDCVILHG